MAEQGSTGGISIPGRFLPPPWNTSTAAQTQLAPTAQSLSQALGDIHLALGPAMTGTGLALLPQMMP